MATKGDKLVKRSKIVLQTILKHFPNSAFCDVSLDPGLRVEIEGLYGELSQYEPKKPKKRRKRSTGKQVSVTGKEG